MGTLSWQKEKLQKAMKFLKETKISPDLVNGYLKSIGSTPLKSGIKIYELLKRPEVEIDKLSELISDLKEFPNDILSEIETEIKYSGYIEKQLREVEKFKKFENMKLPEDLNYYEIPGLSNEMKEKFSKIRPTSIGQALRIPGVTPAAISAIQIYLKKHLSSKVVSHEY